MSGVNVIDLNTQSGKKWIFCYHYYCCVRYTITFTTPLVTNEMTRGRLLVHETPEKVLLNYK